MYSQSLNQTRLPLPERFLVAQQALQRATPPITTLAMLDEEMDFGPLDLLLEKKRPEKCESIEFLDDYRDAGKRWLKYNASVQIGTQRGTGSRWESEPTFETVPVSVQVYPAWDIDLIARLLISEIEAEIDSLIDC